MKKILVMAIFLITIISLSACNKLDVIRDHSIDSFDQVLKLAEDNVKSEDETGTWSLSAPDQSARFVWSKDYSKTGFDVFLETDVKPFLDAGLDVLKLPEGMLDGDKLIVGSDLGTQLTDEKEVSPLESYKKIVFTAREHLKYHGNLDHFGVDLGGGNVFEWAKNMKTNDKDIVFVLNPQVFIDAGVDPDKIEGWIFAKVETMDAKGKKIEVEKLLKPFDLDNQQ